MDKRTFALSAGELRLLALLTMLIDHVGALLLPGLPVLRLLGRLSFPLFAFGIYQGFCCTRSRRRYAGRLVLLGLISEPCFDLAFYGRLFYPGQNSILLTLLLGLGLLAALEACRGRRGRRGFGLWAALLLAGFALLGDALRCDYGGGGVLLIGLFFLLPDWAAVLAGAVLTALWLRSPVQLLAALAAVPLYYRGPERGLVLPRWFRYGFYPGHLLLLALLRELL